MVRRWEILQGDVRETLRTLEAGSVQTCVTSPPYFGLRDYGVSGQIGLEPTPADYVEQMVTVFREVRRVLREDGTLWLNLGDSYAGAGPSGASYQSKTTKEREGKNTDGAFRISKTLAARGLTYAEKKPIPPPGLKPKDLIGIPWRVAFALQQDGWYLRQDIIWHKPNPMPESVRDRCTKAHEYVFLLSKGPRYYYDAEAIAEELAPASFERAKYSRVGHSKDVYGDGITNVRNPATDAESRAREIESGQRNRRSVWTVATQPFKEAHFATYPPELIEPCILAGCPAGGTVLDPFGGAGTTGLVADRLQRDAILIELNPTYAEIARKRLQGDGGMFSEVEAA